MKQSPEDRLERLNLGRCPVHGIAMGQIAGWNERTGGQLDGGQVLVVGCPRGDCTIKAFASSHEGPWELLPEFQHLLRREAR